LEPRIVVEQILEKLFIFKPRFHGEKSSMMDVRTAAAKAAANTGDCQLALFYICWSFMLSL